MQTHSLFAEIPALFPLQSEMQALLLQHTFTSNCIPIFLTLTQNYLFLSQEADSRIPTHFCDLSFALKFELIFQSTSTDQEPLLAAIKLQREGCEQQLLLEASHSIINLWSLQLEKKINQRNFHKLFKAKKKIGKGAFATVYLAERLRDHKMVAVKAFSKEKQFSSEKGRESLENEIKLMRKLSHSNVMKLEGVYETENSIYVILEYLQGQQLNDFLKSGRKLAKEEVRNILQDILRGLSHLAAYRIVHRDLKPENIMFKDENCSELAIGDFGLATHAEEEKYIFVRCGTPGFVAPEIINIKDMSTKCDPISDIFSAGIIFHYLLFGCSIFQGKKYSEVLAQNRSCELNLSSQMYSCLEQSTFDLLRRMLEKDHSKRISADQALNHPYFTGDMDIQPKILFKQATNTYGYQSKFQPKTPTNATTKKQVPFIYEKENPRPFLFS